MASHKLNSDKTTLFIDKLSQPSRAVLWYCLLEKIPDFEVKLVQLRKSEQKTPEFLEINPLGKVPAINDKGFCIGESCTIVRYLADKYGGSALMPKDLQKRAKVDAVLDDHHNNLRQGASRIFWMDFMNPALNIPTDANVRKWFLGVLKQALKFNNGVLVKQAFLAGSEMTFADILVYSEIKQLELTDFDLKAFPAIVAWMEVMSKVPHHNEVFDVLDKLNAASKKKKAAAKL